MATQFPRCKKCKSYLDDDGRCPRCSFVPATGQFPPGMQRRRTPLAASKDIVDVEDDYSEDSNKEARK